MSNIDIWKNYKERKLINSGNYSKIYQTININKGKYEVIKEINKDKCNINKYWRIKERDRKNEKWRKFSKNKWN